MIKQQK